MRLDLTFISYDV